MSEKLQVLFGSECSKCEREAPRFVILVRVAETCKVLVAASETSDMSQRSLRMASRDYSAQCSDDWGERQFWFALITFGAGADRGHDDHDCKFRASEMLEAWKTVILALFRS